MEQAAEQFEKAWERFETNFKGKLFAKSKTQPLTLSQANLILKGVSSNWFSGYGAEGMWLRNYTKECPERAEVITEILKHKLILTSEPEQSQKRQGPEASLSTESRKPQEEVAGLPISALFAEIMRRLFELLSRNPAKQTAPKSPKTNKVGVDKYVTQLKVYKKVILEVIQAQQ